jgi:small conductance mechanosensitive channel
VFEAIAYLAAATLIVGRFDALEELAPYGPRVIKLLGIFFGARVIVELSRVLVGDAMTRGLVGVDEVRKKRVTLVYLVQSLVKYAIYFFAALTMMREIGLDPTPILAGAGIVGLAVGLGAQKLVNDVVSGFFILFEGQILAGDFIKVGDAAGLVEDVQLRVTMVRDEIGRVHVLRNGDIGTVINYSRRYVHAVVEIPIAYEADVREIHSLVEEAGKIIKERHPTIVLEETRAKIQDFQENGMLLRTETKVAPGCHDDLEPEIRSVLAEVFRAKGVEVPYPRRIHIERT